MWSLGLLTELGRDQGCFAASFERGEDGARLLDREDEYGNSILPRKRKGGGIHDREIFGYGFGMRQLFIARRGWIAFRVRRIDTVYLRRLHDKIAGKLGTSQCGSGIGRKEGIAGAARQNDNPALFKVMQR